MPHILLAEDAAVIRMSVAALLMDSGYTCTEAEDAFQARELLSKSAFDLLITDLYMPGDGLSVLHTANRLHPEMPKIVITGGVPLPPKLAASFGRRLGADALLLKPVDPHELVQVVARLTATIAHHARGTT